MNRLTPLARAAATLACSLPLLAQATNGMLLEGYGPVATGMGGAAMAVDNGLAAATNNPATLGLMAAGARLDLAMGGLGPRVSSAMSGAPTADSSGTSYLMPAFGYGRSNGTLAWGIAVFAQGGMGTEYSGSSFLAAGSGQPVRSELGVGRVILPLAFKVSPQLTIGGSLDYVWSNLDLRMAASPQQLGGLMQASGVAPTGAFANPAMLAGTDWARLDFSNSSDFSGAAHAKGYAAKLGLLMQASPALRLGLSYHSRTFLKDMRTTASGATLSAGPRGGSAAFSDSGRITVQDFQMPAQLAAGLAWQPGAGLTVAADLKRIDWSSVMDSFRMRYESAMGSAGFAMTQRWKDQTVLQVGVAKQLSAQWTLRGGANLSTNPVPDDTVSPLFPAIIKRHLTLGGGYSLPGGSEVNGSLAYAPKVSVNTPQGVVVSHRQLNWQLMYSHRF